jgi:hypothetical protein
MKNAMAQFLNHEAHCLEFNLPMLGTVDTKFFPPFAQFVSLLRKCRDLLYKSAVVCFGANEGLHQVGARVYSVAPPIDQALL